MSPSSKFSHQSANFSAYMRKVATSPNSSSNPTDSLWGINHTFRYCQALRISFLIF